MSDADVPRAVFHRIDVSRTLLQVRNALAYVFSKLAVDSRYLYDEHFHVKTSIVGLRQYVGASVSTVSSTDEGPGRRMAGIEAVLKATARAGVGAEVSDLLVAAEVSDCLVVRQGEGGALADRAVLKTPTVLWQHQLMLREEGSEPLLLQQRQVVEEMTEELWGKFSSAFQQ